MSIYSSYLLSVYKSIQFTNPTIQFMSVYKYIQLISPSVRLSNYIIHLCLFNCPVYVPVCLSCNKSIVNLYKIFISSSITKTGYVTSLISQLQRYSCRRSWICLIRYLTGRPLPPTPQTLSRRTMPCFMLKRFSERHSALRASALSTWPWKIP